MKTILLITMSLLLSRFSTNAQWVNLRYGVGDYCADSSRADITCFQADSLRLDVQYYKDLWEEEKRKNYVLVNGRRCDTIKESNGNLVRWFGTNGNIVAGFSFIPAEKVGYRTMFREIYYNEAGQIYYTSSAFYDHEKGKPADTTWVDRVRYEYNAKGNVIKIVEEYFISAGHLVRRSVYEKGMPFELIRIGEHRAKFKGTKIKAYEFWD